VTDHADLTARLRAIVEYWIRGRNTSEFILSTITDAVDALDAADAENARLTAERDEGLAEVERLRAERSAAMALLDIHAKDPFHPDVRAALRGVLADTEEAPRG